MVTPEGSVSCHTQISASGKRAQEINFPLSSSATYAGQAIGTYTVDEDPLAGVMTKNIPQSLKGLKPPDIDAPGYLNIREPDFSRLFHRSYQSLWARRIKPS